VKKTIIYLRCSTFDQSPDIQLNDITSILEPGTKTEIHKEHKSAWKSDSVRPVFDSIAGMIKKNQVRRLYVWDLDRLYRNWKKLAAFMELCKVYNVKLFSFRQQWLNELSKMPDPWNEIMTGLMIKIFGWIAQEESDKKSDRIKNAIRYKDGITVSFNGKPWGRKSLSKQAVNKVLKLHKEGKSIRQIAEIEKVTDINKNQKSISKSAVHKILSNNLT